VTKAIHDAVGEAADARLSFVEGQVSLLRPEAPDRSVAEANTALAPAHGLSAAQNADLEIQVERRGHLRVGAQTQIGFSSIEPDFLSSRSTRAGSRSI
jgi:hypothetical protein